MIALRRIAAVARIELLRLMRSRTTFTLLVLVPALQVLLFGYAIRPIAVSVSVAVAAPTPANAAEAARALHRLPGLTVITGPSGPGSAEKAVRDGRALIGLEVPALRTFANQTQVQRPLRIVVDGTNAALTNAAVARIEAGYWRGLAERAEAADNGPGIAVERLYNPDGRADWTFLPSLIGVTVMIAMVMLGSLSLARDRESGSWEGLLGLPIEPAQTLLGKLLPYAKIGTAQGLLVLAAGVMMFDLPTRGNVGALVLLLPLFAAAHVALGYAISVRARTQLAALQGAVAFYLPAMLLSGFLYPFETLPSWARWIGNAFPLTHFIRAARAALLHGAGAGEVLAHGWPMILFLVAAGAAALLAQARRLD
ncbi:ABC transporter permease [Sphingomonas sp. AR_OL41]|uniref:ABC transporter permease n=1 Tax=Sphingomonas sp. AR_OL41 TaxID=3042729 RepID=UPI00248185B0|nr:ABC transporter permease [Sphingomonas sp. AR_OL41]MDH7971588.1 ABC transporter permease [Sphingomonas sp. AR_OL41]